jgi:hypothetical protein
MAFQYSPKIVTDGLVLYLDAANTKSYVSGSTTWNDISRGGNTGTLVNGPTFNSGNGGSIVFDGTNDYVTCGNILDYTSGNFTFSCWVYINSLTTNSPGQGPILFYKGQFNSKGYYTQITQTGNLSIVTNNPGANNTSTTNSGIISAGNIYNLTFSRNGTSIRIYVNGVDVTTSPGVHANPTTSSEPFLISTYALSIYSNIRIFNFLNYNRALSSLEILQNYNSTKSRFGLT